MTWSSEVNRTRRLLGLMTAGLAAAVVAVSLLYLHATQAQTPRSTSVPVQRVLEPAFAQPRLQVTELILINPSYPQPFHIRWIAPDRLRTDVFGTNLHVGKVGCIPGNLWVCGPDFVPHRPELRQMTMYALFPQPGNSYGNNGYCCLHHLQARAGTQPHTYTITATGDPWLYPLGCQGCGLPGSPRRSISSEHYRATLTVDAEGRPLRLDSTMTLDPVPTSKGTLPGRQIRVQRVTFSYSGTWTVTVPDGKRLSCPSWDRTPGSWCVRAK